MDVHDWPTSIWQDFAHLILAKKLGSGIARDVFELTTDATKVIKVEFASASFQNPMEWQTWNEVAETKWSRWFAPCRWISPCGIVLIQDRTKPLDEDPKQLPNFFTDTKRDNYGLIGEQVVCHDYGFNLLMSNGLSRARLSKPEWW